MNNKIIFEGWTVQDFINELNPIINMIMTNNSYIKPFLTKREIKKWCVENQPYYKKYIPEVVNHFCKLYNISK